MPMHTNILLIRHAEKTGDALDRSLSPAGMARAHAYVAYFQHGDVAQRVGRPDHLFAAADSPGSMRSTSTLAPLSAALGIPVDARFDDHGFASLVEEIRGQPKYDHSCLLVCWHHGELLHLAAALGAPPQSLPAAWPDDVFGWLVVLRFDAKGACVAQVLNQELMCGDCGRSSAMPGSAA